MSTVLITGANRGIGFEFARQYAADGWNVIATCRDPARAGALKDLAKTRPALRIETLDVSEDASIKALSEKMKGTAIDLLINNAGIISGAKSVEWRNLGDPSQVFGTLDFEAWDKVMRINSIGPLMVTQALLPSLLLGKDKKIVMISSRMGSITQADAGQMAYRSSKAALNAAMRNIALSLHAQGISAASLSPGWVRTDMGGTNAKIEVLDSVAGMRKVIGGLTLKDSGQFFGYDGTLLPW